MQSRLRQARPFDPARARVLAYDDTPFNRTVLLEILQGSGLRQARIARTPEEMKDLLARSPYSTLIIPDLLGDQSSLAFLRTLRQHPEADIAQIPVILMSAAVTREHLLEARQSGVDEFLAKPISPAALQARLKSISEFPRPFINCPAYVGPCRRRKLTLDYQGARRRMEDSSALVGAIDDTVASRLIGRLPQLVERLHAPLAAIETDPARSASVMIKLYQSIAAEAHSQKDSPVERAASALASYLLGVGAGGKVDRQVLDTGVNALTQLLLLNANFGSARQTVADALELAVSKKLSRAA